jgi:hypothetical protein
VASSLPHRPFPLQIAFVAFIALSGLATPLPAAAGQDPAASPPAPAASTPTPVPAATPAVDASVDDLAFMAGSWQIDGPPLIEEHWLKPAGRTLLGMSRVYGGDQTYFFEFLRVEQRKDGIFYVAQPKGGPPTEFRLTKVAVNEAVFENLQHDFPKRIIYKKLPDGSLHARTEGDGTEKEKPVDFLYHPQAR